MLRAFRLPTPPVFLNSKIHFVLFRGSILALSQKAIHELTRNNTKMDFRDRPTKYW